MDAAGRGRGQVLDCRDGDNQVEMVGCNRGQFRVFRLFRHLKTSSFDGAF
jgi:hypothetical protein